MDSIERWKSIIGFEEKYSISSIGRVKSLPRETGNQYSNGLIKKTQVDKYGYVTVGLVQNNKTKTFTVHRLVAIAFIPNPENKKQVNHINGIKTDNRVENLEWCNVSYNQKHRFSQLGHSIHNRKLSKDDVFLILSQNGKGWREKISSEMNISIACIKAVRSGRNYYEWYLEYNRIKLAE